MKSKRMVAIWKEGSRVLSRESHGTLRPAWWSEEQKEGPREQNFRNQRRRGRWQGWARRQPQGGVLLFWEVFTPRSNTVWFESQDHSRSCWKLIVGHEWFIIQAGENGSLCLWDTVGLEMGGLGAVWEWGVKEGKGPLRSILGLSSWGWPFTGMRKTRGGNGLVGGHEKFCSSPYVTE